MDHSHRWWIRIVSAVMAIGLIGGFELTAISTANAVTASPGIHAKKCTKAKMKNRRCRPNGHAPTGNVPGVPVPTLGPGGGLRQAPVSTAATKKRKKRKKGTGNGLVSIG